MTMETKATNVEELFQKVKDYTDTRINLFKLKTISKGSGIVSSVLTLIIVMFLFIFVLICITIGFALLIGNWLGSYFYGFFIIAAIYLIVGVILISVRKKLIKAPISNALIKMFLN